MPSSVCCVYRKYLSDYQTINEWYEAFKLSTRDEVLQRPDIRKTGVHPNFWYPVARSDNVKTGKPHPVSFAGELGHLLTMARAKSGERYLLGRINRWLCDFLKRVEPHARYRTPRFYAPHWLRFLNACASETAGRLWPNWTSFVSHEAVQMSRGPHFSSNAKRKANSVKFCFLDRPRHS